MAARDLTGDRSDEAAPAGDDAAGPGPVVAPFGSWSSPIRIDDLVGEVVRLGEPWIDGDDDLLAGGPSD